MIFTNNHAWAEAFKYLLSFFSFFFKKKIMKGQKLKIYGSFSQIKLLLIYCIFIHGV